MKKIYKLEKPEGFEFTTNEIFDLVMSDAVDFLSIFNGLSSPVYLYWDKVKYKKFDIGEPIEKIWAAVRRLRTMQSTSSVIRTEDGNYFKWMNTLPGLEEFFHQVDLNTGGHLTAYDEQIDEKMKMKFISRGIMEEAIASSQLEGANTTRKLAKKFIIEGRKPKTETEHMILNNYKTMKAIEEDYKNKKLSLEMLFELHSMVVKNTVPKNELGKFRSDEDEIVVEDKLGEFIYHVPPKVDFVESEIEILIKFANDEIETGFIHPVVKAIMLHFWIGYLHPFTDGNGRLARLIFYWYLLSKGYWAFAYLPISTIIRKSPIQYGQAYLYSEQDGLDLTYFIDYNIRKIKVATKDFAKYMSEVSNKNKRISSVAKTSYSLNDRQIQLLQFLHENPEEYVTPTIHMNRYQISKSTSIRDIKELLAQGFLSLTRDRKRACYFGTAKIGDVINN